MNTTTDTPTARFIVGQIVVRKWDGKSGTIVTAWAPDAFDADHEQWAYAVEIDGEVWSGTEEAWEPMASSVAPTMPGIAGETVTDEDRMRCEDIGHAKMHELDGKLSERCPRCGEIVAPPVLTIPQAAEAVAVAAETRAAFEAIHAARPNAEPEIRKQRAKLRDDAARAARDLAIAQTHAAELAKQFGAAAAAAAGRAALRRDLEEDERLEQLRDDLQSLRVQLGRQLGTAF